MLRNPAKSLGCELMEGETGDVNDDLANRLISQNIAVASPEEIKAVAKKPPIADAKASSVKHLQTQKTRN